MARPIEINPDDPSQDMITVYNDEIGGSAVVARARLERMSEKGWYEVDPAELAAEEFAGMSKDELIAETEARGLDTSGNKDDLIARLSS